MREEPSPLTVADLGEQGLLALLQSFCPSDLMGDDAAVLRPEPDRSWVVTTDVLVEGVHFSDRTTTPHAIGWRAAAANLSDLAAMGATGTGITVGLSLPPTCPISWVEGVYQGLWDCLSPYGMTIVGGDVCRAPYRSLAITALGQVAATATLYRHRAQPGDWVVVSGPHGGSRAGLALLLHSEGETQDERVPCPPCPAELRSRLIRLHQYPQPRLDLIPLLEQLGDRRPRCAMDSSDGLADAVVQLCRASGVGARIQAHQIPLPEGLADWVGQRVALDWALYGGEDFELVFCLPAQSAQALCAVGGAGLAIVGQITADQEVRLENAPDKAGRGQSRPLTLDQGFQHFL